MIESLKNAAETGARELGERMMEQSSEALLYGGLLAAVRFARQRPLIAVGVGAAAAIGFAALEPATRKKVLATARDLVGWPADSGGTRAAHTRSSKRSGGRASRPKRPPRKRAAGHPRSDLRPHS
jgi:hypothetical protein